MANDKEKEQRRCEVASQMLEANRLITSLTDEDYDLVINDPLDLLCARAVKFEAKVMKEAKRQLDEYADKNLPHAEAMIEEVLVLAQAAKNRPQ